jgi:hypothetical protein
MASCCDKKEALGLFGGDEWVASFVPEGRLSWLMLDAGDGTPACGVRPTIKFAAERAKSAMVALIRHGLMG